MILRVVSEASSDDINEIRNIGNGNGKTLRKTPFDMAILLGKDDGCMYVHTLLFAPRDQKQIMLMLNHPPAFFCTEFVASITGDTVQYLHRRASLVLLIVLVDCFSPSLRD